MKKDAILTFEDLQKLMGDEEISVPSSPAEKTAFEQLTSQNDLLDKAFAEIKVLFDSSANLFLERIQAQEKELREKQSELVEIIDESKSQEKIIKGLRNQLLAKNNDFLELQKKSRKKSCAWKNSKKKWPSSRKL